MNRTAPLSPSEEMDFDGGKVLACVILSLSFLVGAPGNLLVIWTIVRRIKPRSHTVELILHLAAADLLVLITLPLWIYSLAYTWALGQSLCTALLYVIDVCMFSSIFFITLMSVERFLAICHPFVMMRWKGGRVMNRCLLLLWLLALLLGLRVFFTTSSDEADGAEQCFMKEYSSTQATVSVCLETLGGFVLPFFTLCACYGLTTAQLRRLNYDSKQRSLVLIGLVVVTFLLCWLPYHIVNIVDLVCVFRAEGEDECVPPGLLLCSGALVFISSSLNPLLYALLARNFRGNLGGRRLVTLFQEMTTHANKLLEVVVQQQSSQGAAENQLELVSESASEPQRELDIRQEDSM